jgi:hypothetical protein
MKKRIGYVGGLTPCEIIAMFGEKARIKRLTPAPNGKFYQTIPKDWVWELPKDGHKVDLSNCTVI